MLWVDNIRGNLPEAVVEALGRCPAAWLESACELRIRPSGAVLADGRGAHRLCGIGEKGMRTAAACLTRGSLHMLGEYMRQGYVPLRGGFRAGICGRAVMRGGEVSALEDISSICIRISRELNGASLPLRKYIMDGRRVRPTLILSPPGLGKTTMLRDIARCLSLDGFNVAVADERGEIAGMGQNLGPNTDVMSLCPKGPALSMLVRSMRPDVIITDELGGTGDASAVCYAARCGAALIASAHAGSPADAFGRPELSKALDGHVFERIALLCVRNRAVK